MSGLRPLARAGTVILLVAAVALLAGCFESKHPLAPRAAGQRIDPRFLGKWTLEQLDQDGQTNVSKLLVANLRGEEYYVEWHGTESDAEKDDRFRAVGYLTDVNGVTFANLLPLTDTPEPAARFTIIRVDLDGGKLKIQNLDPDFFKDKRFDSPDALRKIVAENVQNEKMYRGEPLYGTK